MARSDSISRGLIPPPPPLTDSQRLLIKQVVRDSLGLSVFQRGDTIHLIPETPRGHATLSNIDKILSRVGIVALTLLVLMAAIYLTIPLFLVGMTALWFWQRRHFASGTVDV